MRAVLAWLVLCVGLGAASGISIVAGEWFDLSAFAGAILSALVMSAMVVPVIVLLRRRLDHRPLAGLGWSRRVGRPLLIGTVVGIGTGAVVWVPAALVGWIGIESVDLGAFVGFLLLNAVVLALYEALPEELALRGYVWTNLRDGWGVAIATVLTTALFPLSIAVASVVAAGVGLVLGTPTMEPTWSPGGQDPISYYLQLIVFGLALIAARRLPIEGALIVAMAFHVTQLTVTRTLLGGSGWLDSGWMISWHEPDAIALVLVHSILAGVVFVVARKRMSHSH